MRYTIEFAPPAVREFKKLTGDVQHAIRERIDALAEHPRPRGVEKLSGEDDLYRIREGEYRIIYQIQDRQLLILVVHIGHRRDVYRHLRKR